jgi:nucleotide-binding universal stress UspA family protein
MAKKNFIVPHDFTDVANIALEHAIATAKPLGADIHVLHVVKNNSLVKDASSTLDMVIEKYSEHGVNLIPSVRIGNIFDDIGSFGDEHQSDMIFMGTHGAHGWQHVTGSHALKVVTSSSIPFIIVQEKSVKQTGYDSIVVPMDLHKETKQKLSVVASIAKFFNSKVHVVTPDETDDFLKNQVESNILFAKRFFADRDISMTSAIVSSSGFDKEIVKYAVSVDADLIAIMNLQKNNLLGLLGTNYEQYMITNDALIPTLIVNPIQIGNLSSAMFTY